MHCIGRVAAGNPAYAVAGSRSEETLYCSSLNFVNFEFEFCGQEEGDNSIFWDSHQVTLGVLSIISIHIAQKFLQISSKTVFYRLIFAKVWTGASHRKCVIDRHYTLDPKNHRLSSIAQCTNVLCVAYA